MKMVRGIKIFVTYAALSAMLMGCAEMAQKGAETKAVPSLEAMLAQSNAVFSTGQPEKATALLKNATKLYPTEKAPWLQMAQIQFDSANYGDAIISALEALHRDPADKLGNSIVAVSGLRLSSKALADLSQQNNLSGSVRTEAQDLAKLLRESLGESVLVPARGKPGSSTAKATAGAGDSGSGVNSVATKNSGNGRRSISADTKPPDSNPFGSLK
jgi:predicted Zn-dependent protease